MAHDPLKMTIAEARSETEYAWSRSYSPERNAAAIESIAYKPVGCRIGHLVARLFFRGIYFPQMGWRSWVKVLCQNRGPIIRLTKEKIGESWRSKRPLREPEQAPLLSRATPAEETRHQEATPLHR